jgi:hypothetical protein
MMLAVAQPVVHQLKDVGLRVLQPSDLDATSDVAVALLEPGGIAGVYPKDPRLRRLAACAIGILDSELRLASLPLAYAVVDGM